MRTRRSRLALREVRGAPRNEVFHLVASFSASENDIVFQDDQNLTFGLRASFLTQNCSRCCSHQHLSLIELSNVLNLNVLKNLFRYSS